MWLQEGYNAASKLLGLDVDVSDKPPYVLRIVYRGREVEAGILPRSIKTMVLPLFIARYGQPAHALIIDGLDLYPHSLIIKALTSILLDAGAKASRSEWPLLVVATVKDANIANAVLAEISSKKYTC